MIFPHLKCAKHGFSYVSMPRDPEEYKLEPPPAPTGYVAKCPLKDCAEGGLRGEGLMAGIIALINDTRESLAGLDTARNGARPSPAPEPAPSRGCALQRRAGLLESAPVFPSRPLATATPATIASYR